MAKRSRSKTRADMIALLKSRGVRGTLSKMTKQQLRNKLDETAPPEDMEGGSTPQRSGELQLEPDPRAPRRPAPHPAVGNLRPARGSLPDRRRRTRDMDLRGGGSESAESMEGGHYFQSFGKASASEKKKYNHTHEKDDMPTTNKQRGSGHDYRDFVAARMRQNGGNMKAAVADWKDQKGGHMVRVDGTVSEKQSKKYAHTHKNLPNPAKTGAKSTTTAAQKPPAAAARRRAPRGDDSLFDTIEQRTAKEKAQKAKQKRADAASRAKADREDAADAADKSRADASAAARREVSTKRKASRTEMQKRAQERLDKGASGNAWFTFRDRMYAGGNFNAKDISQRWKKQKERIAREERDARDKADDLAFAQQEVADEDAERAKELEPLREARRRSGRIPKKSQDGEGYDQDGEGFMDWIHSEHIKHPFLTDVGESAAAAAGILATGGIADLAAGAAGAAGEAVSGAVGDAVEEGVSNLASRAGSTLREGASSLERSAMRRAAGNAALRRAGQEGEIEAPSLTERAGNLAVSAGRKVRQAGSYVLENAPSRKAMVEQVASEGITEGMKDEQEAEEADDTPAPAPAPYHPSQGDLYSANYNALYGSSGDGHTPWG